MQGYERICKDMKGYARIQKDMQGYERKCKDTKGNVRIEKEMQGYKRNERLYNGM